jgi:hypothetical protein
MLYSGIAAALVGLVGTGYAMSTSAMSTYAMNTSAMSTATTKRYRDGYLDMKN